MKEPAYVIKLRAKLKDCQNRAKLAEYRVREMELAWDVNFNDGKNREEMLNRMVRD